MENLFKWLLGIAFFIFGLIFVGMFLLLMKILLIFTPQVNILGLIIR